jgi:hypothetical protein
MSENWFAQRCRLEDGMFIHIDRVLYAPHPTTDVLGKLSISNNGCREVQGLGAALGPSRDWGCHAAWADRSARAGFA